MSTSGKKSSICTRNLKKPPEYSTRLFLFSGVPSGSFFAQGILWMSEYPVTGCVHDIVFEMGNLGKMGIPVGCLTSGGPVVMHD
jgi:hypothetical protein